MDQQHPRRGRYCHANTDLHSLWNHRERTASIPGVQSYLRSQIAEYTPRAPFPTADIESMNDGVTGIEQCKKRVECRYGIGLGLLSLIARTVCLHGPKENAEKEGEYLWRQMALKVAQSHFGFVHG